MSGKITNKEEHHGFLGSEFVAKDEHGHTGFGRTAEEAQYALEIAQAEDLESCVNKAFVVRGNPIERDREGLGNTEPAGSGGGNSWTGPSSGGGVGLIGWVGGIVFALWALERFFTWLDVSLPPVFDLPGSIYVFWPSLVLGLTWVLHKCEVGLVKSFVSATLVVAGILLTILIIVTR